MALELAELSRLDLVSNFKDWRRAVMEAVRARPNTPVELPEDWAFEVQIALNCLLISCVGEAHGRRAMILARHAFEQVLLEQVATTGASFALLERLELLQSVRFATLFALADQEGAEPDHAPQCRRLAADILGGKMSSAQAEPLAGNLAEFRAAMASRVASYALAEISAAPA
jgi:hypothetical protein